MKHINKILIILLLISVALPNIGASQYDPLKGPICEVNKVYPPVSITKEKLKEAQSLIDINPRYESSWVREYISVEITASQNGKKKTVVGKSDVLNDEQKDLVLTADLDKEISVYVQYMPENNLKHNEAKEMDFTFTFDPEKAATFGDGQQQLQQYLKENALDKISKSSFKQYQLAAYKFTIDEEGRVINPSIFWSSDDEKVDEILLETICNMPVWKPAEFANGLKVKQEFVLSIGDMESCVVNLLSINQD